MKSTHARVQAGEMRRTGISVPVMRHGLQYRAKNERTGEILEHQDLVFILRCIAERIDTGDKWTLTMVTA